MSSSQLPRQHLYAGRQPYLNGHEQSDSSHPQKPPNISSHNTVHRTPGHPNEFRPVKDTIYNNINVNTDSDTHIVCLGDDEVASTATFTVTRDTVCPDTRNPNTNASNDLNNQFTHLHLQGDTNVNSRRKGTSSVYSGSTLSTNGPTTTTQRLFPSTASTTSSSNSNALTSPTAMLSSHQQVHMFQQQHQQQQQQQPQLTAEQIGFRNLEAKLRARPLTLKTKINCTATDLLEHVPFLFQPYERSELSYITNVWFTNHPRLNAILHATPRKGHYIGRNSLEKEQDLSQYNENNGYDNAEGSYKFLLGEHIEYRYEILDFLGKGSFGQVVKCFDHKRDTIVALKMSRNRPRLQQQAALEISILETLMRLPLKFDPNTIQDKNIKHIKLCTPSTTNGVDVGDNVDGDVYGEWTSGYEPLLVSEQKMGIVSTNYELSRTAHHHLVRVQGYFTFRNHISVTFEPLSVNLYEFLRMNGHLGLSALLTRRLTHQILLALCFLFNNGLIHCDLKPENILFVPFQLDEDPHPVRVKPINSKIPHISTSIRVIDFGSSCNEKETLFTYVQSRFYRAPEVILGLSYGLPIDMWSFGCILAELFLGFPLLPGDTEHEQMVLLIDLLGLPPPYLLKHATRGHHYFTSTGEPVPNLLCQIQRLVGASALQHVSQNKGLTRVSSILKKSLSRYGYVNHHSNNPNDPHAQQQQQRSRSTEDSRKYHMAEYYFKKRTQQYGISPNEMPKTLLDVIRHNEPILHNLILACLQWDANMRITPKQALQHPFFTKYDQHSSQYTSALQHDLLHYVLPANLVLNESKMDAMA